MVDWRDTAGTFLRGMRQSHMSRSITYTRGLESVDVPQASQLPSQFYDDDTGELVMSAERRDWLVAAADVATLGTPAAGDLITDDTTADEWIVADNGSGRVWQWLSIQQLDYRIFTKRNGS